MSISKVVVPVGSQAEADRVTAIVSQLSTAFDAPLELVRVVVELDSWSTRRLRQRLEPLALSLDADLRLIEHVDVGSALRDHLVADSSAVVCMGVDAEGTATDLLYGSVAEELLRATHHAFVLVGPDVATSHRIGAGRLVVCTDGSDHATSIVPTAAKFGDVVADGVAVIQVASHVDLPEDIDEGVGVRSLAAEFGSPGAEWEVLHDSDASGAIVDYARATGAGLIAMATHGRRGLKRMALGSTAIRVVHRSRCPVVVQRPQMLSLLAVEGGRRTHDRSNA